MEDIKASILREYGLENFDDPGSKII